VARTIDAIQRDIERTRNQLAGTLDELTARTAPKVLADNAKNQAQNFLADPKVQLIIGGVAAGVVLLVGLTVQQQAEREEADQGDPAPARQRALMTARRRDRTSRHFR
jgi:hypothetical protein